MKKFTDLAELSTELLARYKKKASAQSSENDKTAFSGSVSNTRAQELLNKSNKRYKGIIKATGKQFANDTNKVTKGVAEGYWQIALKKAEADREARKDKPFKINPRSHDKNGVYKGDKDLAGNPVPKLKEEVEQIDELKTSTLSSYIKKRSEKEKSRDVRWKSDDHPDVKARRKSIQNIVKAERKMRDNYPADKKAEAERNAKQHEANKPAYKKEMENVKKEYETHHGPIEKVGHHHAPARTYGLAKGFQHGQELHQRYLNLKRMVGEEVVMEAAKTPGPNELHISEVGGGKYKVHAVGSKFAHGIKVGEHLNDTHLDDFSDMGGKIKYVKPQKKD